MSNGAGSLLGVSAIGSAVPNLIVVLVSQADPATDDRHDHHAHDEDPDVDERVMRPRYGLELAGCLDATVCATEKQSDCHCADHPSGLYPWQTNDSSTIVGVEKSDGEVADNAGSQREQVVR